MQLRDKRIVVTGGAGFLGQHVVQTLQAHGCTEIVVPRRNQYDLTREANVERLYADAKPEVVIHLAAVVGGIGANRVNPGRFLYDNACGAMGGSGGCARVKKWFVFPLLSSPLNAVCGVRGG